MTALYDALLAATQASLPLVLLYVMGFQVILVLYILWLSGRIASTTPSQAMDIAKENQQLVQAAKAKIDSLDEYIRESFSKDFSGAMKSFDETTSAVLHQMKDELIQGVQRIENIETAVSKKGQLQDTLEAGSAGVKKLLDAPDTQLAEEVESKPKKKSDKKPASA